MGLTLGTDKSNEQMAGEIAELAKTKDHRLAPYLVDGQHKVNPAQYAGIMAHLSRCPDIKTPEPQMARTAPVRTAQEQASAPRGVIADIVKGFYAVPSATGNNDFDYFKVTEGKVPGYRFVKRVLGGGTDHYPRLEPISKPQQMAALRAILDHGIEESGKLYAEKQVRCRDCGLQLTDEVSQAYGKGPVCREKNG